ncbi:MAG: S53 family peptidase, partial [Bdellovibrionota bacterium]
MRSVGPLLLIPLIAALGILPMESLASPARRMAGHVPAKQIARAQHRGRRSASAALNLTIALKPRDTEGLNDLVQRLYDPSDPAYHHFLTPGEFKDRFAPTSSDVQRAVSALEAQGLKVAQVQDNNLLLHVETDTGKAEKAFQLEIHEYTDTDGRNVHAPTSDPKVSGELADKLNAIVGLSSFSRYRSHNLKKSAQLDPASFSPKASVGSYMTPAKIRSSYGLNGTAANGSGETVGLMQLDGYNLSDINAYAAYFSLTVPTMVNVLVDGVTGSAGANKDEVSMDIELVMAMAPSIAKIVVYEGPNSDQGVLDTYNAIAVANQAKTVSSSWGSPEDLNTVSFRNSENTIFQQLAAQGQSIFVASGDAGAYDDSSRATTLEVDDPASQPYATAVGGTTLTLDGSNNFASESSWAVSSDKSGGGGGISSIWAQPSWQAGLSTAANKGSNTMRMVPDVSLNANPSTGYPIYTGGAWYAIGGTSAAAPLWAAFTALVNQTRISGGLARIGFANPMLYQLGQSSLYSSIFHDIADATTNLYYPAVTGFDLSTGWGSFNGAAMLAAMSSSTLPPYPPTSLSFVSATGSIAVSW